MIIHCGTNNVENDDEEEVLRNFKTLSDSFSRDTTLTFSGIICRADKPYLNEKIDKINTSIQKLCLMDGPDFINNDNIQFRQKTVSREFYFTHPSIWVALNLKGVDTKITLMPKVTQTMYTKGLIIKRKM